MNIHENSTMLDRFCFHMEEGNEKKAELVEHIYNFLENCLELEVCFTEAVDSDG